MGIYLSPVWHTVIPQYREEFGYIDNIYKGGVSAAITSGHRWLLDNSVYSGAFDFTKWLVILDAYVDYRNACIGIVVPDVLHQNPDGTVVGDWRATITRFEELAPEVRKRGYRVVLVSQDGLPISEVPWSDLDVLFIGGSDKHKMSEAWGLIAEAKRRNKWVHVGRVNSDDRIMLFWMADSWDGTTLAIEPSPRNQRRMINAARCATARQTGEQRSVLDGLHCDVFDVNRVG
jgi:hypothetical protein